MIMTRTAKPTRAVSTMALPLWRTRRDEIRVFMEYRSSVRRVYAQKRIADLRLAGQGGGSDSGIDGVSSDGNGHHRGHIVGEGYRQGHVAGSKPRSERSGPSSRVAVNHDVLDCQ